MQVLIKDIGPVKQLSIPVPEDGGIIVLTGRNGAGKSEALAATEKLIRGSGALTKRDRSLGGIVQGFGATIRVGAKTTRSGELEVTSLEDRLHVSDLVDPQIKDPDAADAKRIKALVSLSGVPANKESFYRGWESVVAPAIKDVSDPIEAAAIAKRAIEAEARKAEQLAMQSTAEAEASARRCDGIDLTAESDPKTLQAAHTAAVRDAAAIQQRRASGLEVKERAEKARGAIGEAKPIRNMEDAGRIVADCEAKSVAAHDTLIRLRQELAVAESEAKRSIQATIDAKAMLAQAKGHAEMIARWEADIASAQAVEVPTSADIAKAKARIDAASIAIEAGAMVRTARAERENAADATTAAKCHTDKAASARAAAGKIDEALSAAVACDELRVESGRLVTDTEDRGPTYYADLSAGQRWKIALRIAIAAVGERGVLVIPQEAFEGLDPDNRNLIAEEVKGRKVTIITALPSSGELRAEPFAAAQAS